MSASSAQSLKRGRDAAGFAIPRLPSPSKRSQSRSVSPTKKNTRGILDLENLRKPVYIKGGDDYAFPDDIKDLYRALRKTDYKQEVIPDEVFDLMRTAVGDLLPEFSRCKNPTPSAATEHALLQDIHLDAVEAVHSGYHEAGWNTCVHGPLLKMIFPTKPRPSSPLPSEQAAGRDTPRNTSKQPPSIRLVPVMSAAIHPDHVPKLRPRVHPLEQSQDSPVPTLSDVLSAQASENATTTHGPTSDAGDALSVKNSDTEKVDYVLTMEPAAKSPLASHLYQFLYNESVDKQRMPPHINQSAYGPLQQAPIAVSIETKLDFSGQNPMLQLAIWIAAWHGRMEALREFLFAECPSLRHVERMRERLPTALLIEVASHEWRLYFACDRKDAAAIDIVGPLRLGSTANMLDLYVLFAALRAIKDWAEGKFRRGVERWFLVDEVGKLQSRGVEV